MDAIAGALLGSLIGACINALGGGGSGGSAWLREGYTVVVGPTFRVSSGGPVSASVEASG